MDYSFWMAQLLNAMQYSMLLFLLSIGLTVVFGLLHFVNLAHGAFYMLGAYVGYSIVSFTDSFVAAFFLAPVVIMAVGAGLYLVLIDRLRSASPMKQVLVTFGLIFILMDIARITWGDIALGINAPALLTGTVDVLGVSYPAYRLFIISLGLAIMAFLWILLAKTQIGAMIRSSVENGEMASALGINVGVLFFIVFCVGCALAGLAGIVAAPVFSVSTGMGTAILIPTLIVVVIGGLGSLQGAIAGSLIIGFIETIGAVFLPNYAAIASYALLALVLVFRPQGLIPARA